MKYTWNVHGQRQNFALGPNATYIPLACVWVSRRVKTQIRGFALAPDTNMLVSPTPKSGVGGIAQRQPQTPSILRRSGI